jgi:hypothetical protein
VDVGPDVTTFGLTTLTKFAMRGGMLLSDIVRAPALRDSDFQRVRQLRVDRLRQLKDLAPATAERVFLRVLYDGHPYGHLAIGNDAALRALSLAEVSTFHAHTYHPRGAMLTRTRKRRRGRRPPPSSRQEPRARGWPWCRATGPRSPSCGSATCRRAATRRIIRRCW